jgi:hypothetical protein
LDDFERFKCQKAADIQEILLNFVNLQIEFNRKSSQMWQDMVPVLSAVAANIGNMRPSQTAVTNPMTGNTPPTSSSSAPNPFGDFSSSAPSLKPSGPFHDEVTEEDMVGV